MPCGLSVQKTELMLGCTWAPCFAMVARPHDTLHLGFASPHLIAKWFEKKILFMPLPMHVLGTRRADGRGD